MDQSSLQGRQPVGIPPPWHSRASPVEVQKTHACGGALSPAPPVGRHEFQSTYFHPISRVSGYRYHVLNEYRSK